LEALAPWEDAPGSGQLDRDGPNPEYPWPSAFPTVTPVEHEFDLWTDLNTPAGRQFLTLLSRLFKVADAYL